MAKRETLFKIDQQAGGGVGGSIFLGGPGGGTPGAHNLADTSIHLGPLLRSQAPWVADDIAAHAALPDVHHPRVNAGAGISVNVPTQEVSVSLDGLASGLTFNANNQLLLGTPGTISAFTANNLDGSSHYHAVLAHSDGAANPNHLAKFAGDGGMAFARVTTPLINTTTGNLLIDPAGDVLFPQAQTVRSQNFTPGFPIQGWWIGQYDGGLGPSATRNAMQIYSMTVDELRARAFVVDEVRVDRGEEFVSKSYGTVARPFTTPMTVGGTVTVYFEDSPAYTGAIFSNGDHLLFRIIDDSGGGLTIANIEFTVSNYTARPDNQQSWTLTLVEGLTSFEIRRGMTAWDMGQSGQGYIHSSVIDASGAPYMDIRSWSGSHFLEATQTTHLRVGRLISALDNDLSPTGWGLFSTNAFLKGDVIAANGNIAALSNIGLNIKASTNETQWEDWPLHLTFSTDPIHPSLGNTVLQIWGERWGGNNQGYIRSVSGVGTGVENAHIQIGTRRLTGLPDVNGATITFSTTNATSDVAIFVRHPTSPPTKGSFTIDANTTVNGHVVPTVGGFYDLGSPGAPIRVLYVGNVVAQTITGEAMSGSIWEYNTGDMVIRSAASSARTLFVANPGSGTMHLDVEGNIIVGGTVDGVNVAGFKSNYDAHIANPNAHHAQAHVLATTSALGPDHTVSGLSAGQVLRATSSTAARFMFLNHADLAGVTADQHHNQIHVFATDTALGPDHTISGASVGHVFRATGPTTGRIMQLSHSDLGGIGPNQHHNQVHSITGSDHTISASQFQLVGATATNTLGLLTPSSNPGAAAALLRTGTSGDLTLRTLTVQGNVDITNGGDLTVGANVLFVDVSQGNVGINRAPDPQFDLDVAGALRATYLVGKHAIQLSGARMINHFDGPEPYSTNFTGELAGHMGQPAITSGPVIFRPGRFGKAVQVGEGTTNLITNPSFETNITGWASSWGDTLTRSSEQSAYGDWSLKVIASGTTGSGTWRPQTVTANVPYTFSAWVYIPSSWTGPVPSVRIYNGNDFNTLLAFTNADTSIRDEWQRITVTAIPTLTTIRILVFCGGATTNGQFWYVDAAQLEQLAYPTAYCDGSLPGHTWSGTAHASTSNRAGARAQWESIGGAVPTHRWSLMFWIYSDAAYGLVDNQYVLELRGDVNNRVRIYQHTINPGVLRLAYSAEGNTQFSTLAPLNTMSPDQWHHVVLSYDGTNLRSYLDGALIQTLTRSPLVVPVSQLSIGTLYDSDANHTPTVLIDDLVILDRVIPEGEIRAVYESDAPVFAESSTFQFRVGNGLAWGDSEGLFARDVDGTAVFAVVGVDGKSWGGVALDKGDVMIGNSTAGYLQFDRSAQNTTLADVRLQMSSGGTKFLEVNPSSGISFLTYESGSIGAPSAYSLTWHRTSTTGTQIAQIANFIANTGNAATAGTYLDISVESTATGPGLFRAQAKPSAGAQTAEIILKGSRSGANAIASIDARDILLSGTLGSTTYIDQISSTAAIPTLALGQADLSEEFIEFSGTIATGNPINTTALGSYYGRVRVSVNGTFKWLALYN